MTRQNENYNRYLLSDWRPENPAFWENKGKGIARRNLWISVSCLLLAFCVWMLFSAVAVNLNKIGFNFTTDQLFLLTALPSLSGAILRVPYSFMVPLFGGRKWTVLSTVILIIPCAWLGFAVQNPATPFGVFMLIALLCGFAVLRGQTSRPVWATSVFSFQKPDKVARWVLTAAWEILASV